jgi:malonyl CoA-acyl carrier protein transacylase
VSIAAHSPLMASIQAEWNAAVDACDIGNPQIPVVGNVHAKSMLTAEELRADIKAQLQSRVRWTESVLLGMIKRIEPSAVRIPLGNPKDFVALQE